VRFGGALIILAACVGAAPAASAADAPDPICADRPGLATPPCTVPAGMLQLEMGLVDWVHHRSAGVRSGDLAIGATTIKLGLTDRLHVELGIAPYVRSRVSFGGARTTASGFGDLLLAAKYRLTGEEAPVQVALRPFVKLPTAKPSLGNGKVEGGIVVPVSFAIPGSQLSLGLSPELDLNVDADGSGHHLATGQVVSLGMPLSARLSASLELAGYWNFDPEGTVRQYAFGASAGYLLTNDIQLDAGVNLGLNRETPDVHAYAGFAFRF